MDIHSQTPVVAAWSPAWVCQNWAPKIEKSKSVWPWAGLILPCGYVSNALQFRVLRKLQINVDPLVRFKVGVPPEMVVLNIHFQSGTRQLPPFGLMVSLILSIFHPPNNYRRSKWGTLDNSPASTILVIPGLAPHWLAGAWPRTMPTTRHTAAAAITATAMLRQLCSRFLAAKQNTSRFAPRGSHHLITILLASSHYHSDQPTLRKDF